MAEDDQAVRDLLVETLTGDGYDVRAVADGAEVLAIAAELRPDLVLLDAGLPGVDGWSVARRLRQATDLPIIFVTGSDSPDAIRTGFDLGGDDYVVKPFDPEVLSARVKAVLRRAGRDVPEVWELDGLVVDRRDRSVTRNGQPVNLTTLEFNLLEQLVRNRSRVVSKQQLLAQVWGYGGDVGDEHLVEVHMSSLRAKLEVHGSRVIHTVRGAGYLLRPSD